MTATILLVEDDPSLLLGLKLNLAKAGYDVRIAADGARGLAEYRRRRPDLVVLDLMLPEIDGLEILRTIRAADPQQPVIVVTALGNEHDKVRGLDLGANDYVTKPFSVPELLARVRAVLRTAAAGPREPAVEVLRAGAIEVEPACRRVSVEGTARDLTAREFDLLVFFMRHPERVLTREQLLVNVWGDEYDGTDRTVDNFVSILRRKLDEDPTHPRHLRTVWGVGYRFVP